MNKFLLLVFSFVIIGCYNLSAQSRLIWSSTSAYSNAQITESRSFAVDNSGNNYSVNFTQSALSFYVNYVFYAHNAAGVKLWEFTNDSCFTDCNDKYFNIVPIENDGAIFIGAFDDLTGTQVRVKRIDANGNLLWQQYWISPFLFVKPIKSLLDNSGNLIIGLSVNVNITDQEDFAIAKFDTTNGFLDWHIELPDDGSGSNSLSEIISSITVDASDNIYGVGTGSDGTSGVTKNYIFKVDDSGNLDYRRESSYSGGGSNILSLQHDNNGSLYTLGFTGSQPVIEKRRASSGSLIWSEEITKDSSLLSNVGFTVIGNSIFTANNFTYFIPDTSFAGGYWSNQHYILTSLDTSGAMQWQNQYFTTFDSLALQDGYGGAVQLGACNNNLYILSNQHFDALSNKLILHKVDLSGNTIWYDTASVNNDAGIFGFDNNCEIYLSRTFDNFNITEKYATGPLNEIANINESNIFEVYPNPAHEEFTIQFSNEKFKGGSIAIYNSIGALIKHETISENRTTIQLKDFAAGIFLVQFVSTSNEKFTKILVKN